MQSLDLVSVLVTSQSAAELSVSPVHLNMLRQMTRVTRRNTRQADTLSHSASTRPIRPRPQWDLKYFTNRGQRIWRAHNKQFCAFVPFGVIWDSFQANIYPLNPISSNHPPAPVHSRAAGEGYIICVSADNCNYLCVSLPNI